MQSRPESSHNIKNETQRIQLVFENLFQHFSKHHTTSTLPPFSNHERTPVTDYQPHYHSHKIKLKPSISHYANTSHNNNNHNNNDDNNINDNNNNNNIDNDNNINHNLNDYNYNNISTTLTPSTIILYTHKPT